MAYDFMSCIFVIKNLYQVKGSNKNEVFLGNKNEVFVLHPFPGAIYILYFNIFCIYKT
jgi:hypothetical protein